MTTVIDPATDADKGAAAGKPARSGRRGATSTPSSPGTPNTPTAGTTPSDRTASSGQPGKGTGTTPSEGASRYVWYDLRGTGSRPDLDAVLDAARRLRPGGVLVEENLVGRVPAGLERIALVSGTPSEERLAALSATYDVLILDGQLVMSNWFLEHRHALEARVGAFVDVVDPQSLQAAVEVTHHVDLVLVTFKDSTKIPLEIVLAEAQNHSTEIVMGVRDSVEANVVFGVLEIGAAGVLCQVPDLAAVHALDEVITAAERRHGQQLVPLTVIETKHVGMGDRACLDFTSYLGLDEGVLLGCFSNGGILATSETHALPYMPTRPFRVNAGSLQMYVLAPDNQTWYLSDLRAGMTVLAVKTDGTARPVTVGRVKIERRPMLQILAEAPDGTRVTTIMQEDWHVRVFGTHAQPCNITELKPGDQVAGYTTQPGRHVGVKVDELIIEQ